jgi:UDP-glucuronate 4-epimerase
MKIIGKHFLITGGAGFIGSHLAERLLQNGARVTVVDNFDEFYPREIKLANISSILKNGNFTLAENDIRDKAAMSALFSENRFDAVVHLAAKAGVRPSIENAKEYFDVNVNGTLVLLEEMKNAEVKNLIFASSSSVYGANKKIPFSENDFTDNPISPYAASKKSGEALCHTFHHLYGINVHALRFFTVYGPRQRPDLAIHKFARKILDDEPLPVFGDGKTRRDYTYIDDIIQGVILSIEKLSGFEIINLGESRTIELLELINLIENEIGKKAKLNFMPPQPGDVPITYADISKARELLGYNPQFPIEKGIRNFVAWLRKG